MKEFFEKVKKTIFETADVVGKKTGDVVDTVSQKTGEIVEEQKLKSQIRTMKRENERDYGDIGKVIFERFQAGDMEDAQLLELCEAIAERTKSIAENEKKIAELKGYDVCHSCGAVIEPAVSYCSKCGTKVGEESVFEDETEE